MEIMNSAIQAVENAKDCVTCYMTEEIPTSRKQILTICTIFAMAGIILGFFLSPIKKGIHINISNNGNNVPQGEQCNNKEKKGK